MLLSIGSAFIYYADHFKLYSLFCASHSKAQKALHPSKCYRKLTDPSMQKQYTKDKEVEAIQYRDNPIKAISSA